MEYTLYIQIEKMNKNIHLYNKQFQINAYCKIKIIDTSKLNKKNYIANSQLKLINIKMCINSLY